MWLAFGRDMVDAGWIWEIAPAVGIRGLGARRAEGSGTKRSRCGVATRSTR